MTMSLVSERFSIKPIESANISYTLGKLKEATESYKGKFEIIDQPEDVFRATEKLKKATFLAIDCEGVNLGKGGKLTLVQVAEKHEKIYLFDILKLGQKAFDKGLQQVLEDLTINKYMYDCRGDSDSLWNEYKVRLTNVFDMQLFEFIVRPTAGKALRSPCRPSHHRRPIVRGLNATVKTYVQSRELRKIGISDFDNVKDKGAKTMNAERTIWRYRPLSEGLKKYAALDIETIWLVVDALKEIVPIKGLVKEQLKIASERFVEIRSDVEKPDDLYIRHAILPCYVIPEIKNNHIEPFPLAWKRCEGCKRMLPSSCIEQNLCEDCREVVRANRYR